MSVVEFCFLSTPSPPPPPPLSDRWPIVIVVISLRCRAGWKSLSSSPSSRHRRPLCSAQSAASISLGLPRDQFQHFQGPKRFSVHRIRHSSHRSKRSVTSISFEAKRRCHSTSHHRGTRAKSERFNLPARREYRSDTSQALKSLLPFVIVAASLRRRIWICCHCTGC